MPSGRARSAALVALGAWLASRGALAAFGLVVTGGAGLAAAIAAFAMTPTRAAMLPGFASEVIAWAGGMTLAFGAALRAVRLDREEGVLALARARGASLGDYVRGRVGGLVVVVGLAVGGATLVACVASIAAAHGGAVAARTSVGAMAYALVFAATLAPVALAALGARTRAGGYLTLVAILVLPEVLGSWTERLLPTGWRELTSIPSALEAVRLGVSHPVHSGAHAARALAGLAAVIALAMLAIAARTRYGRAQGEP
jgi:hypothetical protein